MRGCDLLSMERDMSLEDCNIVLLFLPFAYGGNPGTESGPKAIKEWLEKQNMLSKFTVYEFSLAYNETPNEYLKRIEHIFEKLVWNKFDRYYIFGGNHLSIFPIYSVLYKYEKSILTLDAHRDYYPGKDINHATFMKDLCSDNVTHIIGGCRDWEKHNQQHRTIKALKLQNGLLEDYVNNMEEIGFLDIDVDVMNDIDFPFYCCYLEKGIDLENVKRIINIAREKNVNTMPYLNICHTMIWNKMDLK